MRVELEGQVHVSVRPFFGAVRETVLLADERLEEGGHVLVVPPWRSCPCVAFLLAAYVS